jgi:hypothetical protein
MPGLRGAGGDRRRMADPPQLVAGCCGGRGNVPGPRDRDPSVNLLRENPWLQLQGGGTSNSMSAMPR